MTRRASDRNAASQLPPGIDRSRLTAANADMVTTLFGAVTEQKRKRVPAQASAPPVVATAPVPPLEFVVPGAPVPKARARVVRRRMQDGSFKVRSFTPAKTAAYEKHVRATARKALTQWRRLNGQPWPTDAEAYRLSCVFYREANRGDLANFIKSVEDALNPPRRRGRVGQRVVWSDDAHVTQYGEMSMCVDSDNPRAVVRIEVIAVDGCPGGRHNER